MTQKTYETIAEQVETIAGTLYSVSPDGTQVIHSQPSDDIALYLAREEGKIYGMLLLGLIIWVLFLWPVITAQIGVGITAALGGLFAKG